MARTRQQAGVRIQARLRNRVLCWLLHAERVDVARVFDYHGHTIRRKLIRIPKRRDSGRRGAGGSH